MKGGWRPCTERPGQPLEAWGRVVEARGCAQGQPGEERGAVKWLMGVVASACLESRQAKAEVRCNQVVCRPSQTPWSPPGHSRALSPLTTPALATGHFNPLPLSLG